MTHELARQPDKDSTAGSTTAPLSQGLGNAHEGAQENRRATQRYGSIPKNLIVGPYLQTGVWAELSHSAKAVLGVLKAISNGVKTGLSMASIARLSGLCLNTVRKALDELQSSDLVMVRLEKTFTGRHCCAYEFTPAMLRPNRGLFARLDHAVVAGGAWAEMGAAGRAVYMVLLAGVQHQALQRFRAENPELLELAWPDILHRLNTDESFRERFAHAIPKSVLRATDNSIMGIKLLARLSGCDPKMVRPAINRIVNLGLAACFKVTHGKTTGRAFVLPVSVNRKFEDGFWEKRTPPTVHTRAAST